MYDYEVYTQQKTSLDPMKEWDWVKFNWVTQVFIFTLFFNFELRSHSIQTFDKLLNSIRFHGIIFHHLTGFIVLARIGSLDSELNYNDFWC